MSFLTKFLEIFIHYCLEVWWVLAIGFLISGLISQFISTHFVEKYLGQKGIKPIILSAIVGVFLPVCCIGSLPVANTLWKKGARLGAVLAFLVATPATSVSALLMTLKFMGLEFTLFLSLAVIVMALILGFICEWIPVEISRKEEKAEEKKSCCHHDAHSEPQDISAAKKIQAAFKYAFITLPKEMGFEILLGLLLASLVMAAPVIQQFIQDYLTGIVGYISVTVIGLISYVCSTASVPMADAFYKSGMSAGQAMCYLLVGPITSLATILVIRKDFGARIMKIYLSVIIITSVLFSLMYDFIIKG